MDNTDKAKLSELVWQYRQIEPAEELSESILAQLDARQWRRHTALHFIPYGVAACIVASLILIPIERWGSILPHWKDTEHERSLHLSIASIKNPSLSKIRVRRAYLTGSVLPVIRTQSQSVVPNIADVRLPGSQQ